MNANGNESADGMRRAHLRFNMLMAILLVLVGVLVSWYMFRALYPNEGPAPMYLQRVVKDAARGGAAQGQSQQVPGPLPAGGAYAIQLLPFADPVVAEQLRATLGTAGIASSARLETHIRVGPLRSVAELDTARAKLKELGVSGGQVVIQKQ